MHFGPGKPFLNLAPGWARVLLLGRVVLPAFLGGLVVWSDVASHAYIPALLKCQKLVVANGRCLYGLVLRVIGLRMALLGIIVGMGGIGSLVGS